MDDCRAQLDHSLEEYDSIKVEGGFEVYESRRNALRFNVFGVFLVSD